MKTPKQIDNENLDGPLYKDVDELHRALVEYAVKAHAQATEKFFARDGSTEKNFPEFVLSQQQRLFVDEAKERFAQVAGYLWMKLEDLEDRKLEVDGKPLSSIEEAIYAGAFVAGCAASPRAPAMALVTAARLVREFRTGGKK